jgi:hypothetical protein
VRRVRQEVTPLPVTVTALPSWLAWRQGFAALLAAADGFVLQVHALARPSSPAAPLVICDPAAARDAVEAAARYRRPFRVALPTYGAVAAFTARGDLLGLAAEGPALRWPAGTVLTAASSDAGAMAALVREWTRDRPRELTGIVWYRLPAAGDRRNWSWPTLRAVMAGRPPRHRLQVVRRPPPPGAGAALAEIEIGNLGEAAEPWPPAVELGWKSVSLLAADGLAGYRALPRGPAALRLELPAASGGAPAAPGEAPDSPLLEPGERRLIGWLRFAGPTEVTIGPAPPPAAP